MPFMAMLLLILAASLSLACENFIQIEQYGDTDNCQDRDQPPGYTQVWGLDCCINYVDATTAGQIWSATQIGEEIQVNVKYYTTGECKNFVGGDNYTYSTACNSEGEVASILSTPTTSQLYDGASYMSNTYVTTEACTNKDTTDFTLQFYYRMNTCIHAIDGVGSVDFSCSTSANKYTELEYAPSDCEGEPIAKYEYKGQEVCKHNLHSNNGIIWTCSEP